MVTTIYDNWGRSHTLPGDYADFPRFFRLQHLVTDDDGVVSVGSELLIREPAGWDKLKISLNRDEDWYGVDYELSVSDSALSFDVYSGRDYIQAIFSDEGADADILLAYGTKKDNSTYIVEFEGRLMLETRKKVKSKIQCGIERKTLASVVRARWETPVNLFGGVDLDGYPTGYTLPTFLPLTPQAIGQRFECIVNGGARTEQTITGDADGHVWIQFDTSSPQVSEIEDFTSGRPAGFSAGDGPIENDEWLHKFKTSGVRKIKLQIDYRLWVSVKKRSIGLTKAKITGYSLNTWLVLKRANGNTEQWAITTPLAEGKAKQPANNSYGAPDIGISGLTTNTIFSVDVNTEPGDKLYWYGAFLFTHNLNELGQTQVTMQVITQRLTIEGLTENKGSLTIGLTPESALNTALRMISQKPDALRSDYFGLAGGRYGVNGPGAMRILAKGYHLRGFSSDPANINLFYPFTVSMQDLMKGLQAIDGIGRSFSKEIDGLGAVQDVMRVEPMRYFFRDVELLDLGRVSNYREDTVKEELYSKVVVGYSKWVDEGTGAMEEFLGKSEIALPIRHQFGTATYVSDLIASSLAIENIRREQFAEKPKDSTTNDDATFIIACQTGEDYSGGFKTVNTYNEFFGFSIGYVELPAYVPWIVLGSAVTLSGGPYNGVTFAVTGVAEASATPWTFSVAQVGDLVNATVSAGTITNGLSLALQPETGADMATVSGLTSPNTTYNIRLSPGRNLLRNTPRWAGCLAQKPETALLQKVKLSQNAKVVSRITSTSAQIGEKQAIAVDELTPQLLITPDLITCEKRLSWQEIQRLRLGLTGQLPIGSDSVDRNYGFVTLLDDNDDEVTGYVYDLTYQPATGKASLQIRRRAVDLIDTLPENCAEYAGWTLAQVETADAQTRRRIELCRYADVDTL